MSNNKISTLTTVNLVLSSVELFTGVVFFYFNFKYVKAFRRNTDPFTLCCFSLVMCSILAKTIPRLFYYSLKAYDNNKPFNP